MSGRFDIVLYTMYFLFLGVILTPCNAQATRKFTPTEIWEAGLPYIHNYSAKDYQSHPQNWCFTEADNGLMYVGNTMGVLEYDGVQWRTIALTNSSLVRSLAKSDNGRIYVGGVRELGYLDTDSIGRMQYRSLLPKLDSIYHDFGDVWNTRTLGGDVYFRTDQYLLRWNGHEFRVWEAKLRFGDMFIVHDQLYIQSAKEGIVRLEKDSLKLVPDGDYFNQTLGRVTDMQPLSGGNILLTYSYTGLYKYDQKAFLPVFVNPSEFEQNPLYAGTLLNNGDYAASTKGKGIYIFDLDKGVLKEILNKEDGLVSDVIFNMYTSGDGTLWVGTDNGISRVDMASSLRKFDERLGLGERVRNVVYNNGTLYIGSNSLYYLDVSTTKGKHQELTLKKVDGLENNARHIFPVGRNLFYLTGSFIYLVDEQNQVHLIDQVNDAFTSSTPSRQDSTMAFVGTLAGSLYELNNRGTGWQLRHLTQIDGEVYILTQDHNGDLWVSTQYNGLHRVKQVSDDNATYKTTHYTEADGLPTPTWNLLYDFDQKIYVGTEGMFTYDPIEDRFYRDSLLMRGYKEEVDAFGPMAMDASGAIWQTVREGMRNKIYKIEDKMCSELPESNLFTDFSTYDIHTAGNVVFFSGPTGIIAYNKKLPSNTSSRVRALVRTVHLAGDSLVYGGPNPDQRQFELPVRQNSLTFNYSLPDFNRPSSNEYQYMLSGFDDEWSGWTSETKVNYTNLSEGDYTFKVRAKNVYGSLSRADSFSFRILPPWYRSWWAYLLYVLLSLLVVWSYALWNSRRLQRKNLILEGIIKRRTEEIREKNKQLSYQAEKLKEMDTMKTRLFANISHEFRTPLTLIKGPVEKLERANENKISTTNIKMIRRNANRLLNLVNQLLDLSKLDSKKLDLNKAEGDVFKCIRAAASSFSSHAAARQMDYQIKIPSRLLWAEFDRDKLEKIVYNLLSNAFKFTEDEGRIIIQAEFRSNRLKLKVSDTGAGMDSDKLPHIFDRFFQVDDSYTREKSGSGIGLALTKELVELMGGTIFVESELGRGSLFRVVLPLEEIKSKTTEGTEVVPEPMEEVPVYESAVKKTKDKDTMVLIIEDNNDMRHFIREQLETDYGVQEARNGREGLQLANKLTPDLIITDLMMPQMDGITLCKKLKTQLATSHIPVIMLTAKAGIENKLEGLETGADEYLTKPFNAIELQVRAKNLISQRQQLRELFSRNISLDPGEITVTSLDEDFLQKLLSLMEEKYSDSQFGVPQMQKDLGMSKTALHSKIKALTNHPPGELLRNFRLKRAAQLLSQSGENISQTAYDVGFNSLSYFTRCFKQYYGLSPTEFLRKESN